ncbi:MAG: HAD family hydrolase [Nitriliruptoraceae bacterium]
MTALPQAVVFDCDGTLADTEPISDRAWADVLRERGYVPTVADARETVGRPYRETFAHFDTRVPLGDPAVFRRALRERFLARFATELVLFDDAVGLLRALAGRGVPIGVASSSTHAHVARVLERAEVDGLVDAVVGSDDVTRHKPDPEPYRRALRLLEAEPSRSAAVEDTDVGVASARAAGLFTIAVVRGHIPPGDLAAADRIVLTVSLDDLEGGPWTS